MGDFNAILNSSEKEGGLPLRRESTEPFQDFIFSNGLIDMGFSGQTFTWDNKKIGDAQIRERLDRAICSISWRDLFQDVEITHELIIRSDHCPNQINPTPFQPQG
ncbi:hypothetical protein LINPERHAP2_LOCUS23513 [Linum perenne]